MQTGIMLKLMDVSKQKRLVIIEISQKVQVIVIMMSRISTLQEVVPQFIKMT